MILTREKYSRNFIIKNNEYKIQNILNPYFWEITSENQKNKNQKKFFSIAAPHRQPAEKGEGVRVKNVGGIYSAGKYPVLAICVRTQIDFYLKGGISIHPHNKTRWKRFIFVYNGRYTHKQDGTRLKMNIYA